MSLVPAALLVKRAAAAKKKAASAQAVEKSTVATGASESQESTNAFEQLPTTVEEDGSKEGNNVVDDGEDSDATVVSEDTHGSNGEDVDHILTTPTPLCEVYGTGTRLEGEEVTTSTEEVVNGGEERQEKDTEKEKEKERTMLDMTSILKSTLSIGSDNDHNHNNGESNVYHDNSSRNNNGNSVNGGADGANGTDSKALLGSLIHRTKERRSSMKTVVMPDNVIKTTEQLQKEEYLFPFMEEDGNMYQVCQDHMHTQPEAALPQQQVPSSNPSRVRAFTYDQVTASGAAVQLPIDLSSLMARAQQQIIQSQQDESLHDIVNAHHRDQKQKEKDRKKKVSAGTMGGSKSKTAALAGLLNIKKDDGSANPRVVNYAMAAKPTNEALLKNILNVATNNSNPYTQREERAKLATKDKQNPGKKIEGKRKEKEKSTSNKAKAHEKKEKAQDSHASRNQKAMSKLLEQTIKSGHSDTAFAQSAKHSAPDAGDLPLPDFSDAMMKDSSGFFDFNA